MSARDELTIWILRTAMNAPSVAPTTATQVRNDGLGGSAAGGATLRSRPVSSAECASLSATIPPCSLSRRKADMLLGRQAVATAHTRCFAVVLSLHACRGLRIDDGLDGHAWAQ